MDTTDAILESKYPEYQFLIKGPLHKVWRDGFPVDEQKILTLQFDRFICFIEDMQREQEWTTEEREYVDRTINQQLDDHNYRDMWVHQPVLPEIPWPTYNETHPKQIHVIAQSVGLVEQALRYEQHGRPDGPRPDVIKNLEGVVPEKEEKVPEGDELYAT